jgi:hypothetical protein
MGTGRVGGAISTTGDPHRMRFLETCVRKWDDALPPSAALFITVDGDEADCARVYDTVDFWTHSVFQVGAPKADSPAVPRFLRDGRCGVAASKNTGLELLMGASQQIEHLFLSDDDTWPLSKHALAKHIELSGMGILHSMVCWGANRLLSPVRPEYASWSWPRGVMMYTHRTVVAHVGGMDERFGPGGHEHAEWSRRIHQHGLTPEPFVSPRVYAETGLPGRATRASVLWHCEDMRRPGEPMGNHRARKRHLTSVKRTDADWPHIDKIMAERDGDTSYVPFRAHENRRGSATLIPTSTGQGAGGDL